MTDYRRYINALRKCAKENENDRTSTGYIILSDLCRDTANLLEALEQKESGDVLNGRAINVHEVKPTDEDYPALVMCLVPKADQYTLFSIDRMTVVPLYQVIDAIMTIKPDTITRDGVEYCANCGAKMEENT